MDQTLKKSFLELSSFLQDEQRGSQVPAKVKQKLRFLEDSLNNPEQPPERQSYELLHEDELNQLSMLPREAKTDLYLNIVHCLVSKSIFLGELDIMGSVFWNERQIELHQLERRLRIWKKKNSTQTHEIDLANYVLKWVGQKKDKCCLQLLQVRPDKSKFKEILIGSTNPDLIREWYAHFQKCCKELHTDKAPKKPPEESKRNWLELEDKKDQLEYYNLATREQPQNQLPHLLQPLKDKLSSNYLHHHSDFHLLNYERECRILQHKQDPYHLRACLVLPKMESEKLVFHALSDHQQEMSWNQAIKSQEICLVLNESTALVRREMREVGVLYRSRGFEVMRHVHLKGGRVYLVEKSASEGGSVVRWCITSMINKRVLVCDTSLRNGGYLTQQQDVSMSVHYLQQFASFAHYLRELKHSRVEIVIPKFIEDLFDNRDASKEQEEQQEQQQQQQQQQQASVEQLQQKSMEEQLKEVELCLHWAKALCRYNLNIRARYNDSLQERDEQGNHFFFKDEWVTDESKGVLKFVHRQKLALQKQVFTFILKKIGSNLIAGKSILNISLPVSIFDNRSNLERLASSFAYAPLFLETAAQNPNPIRRLHYAFLFAISFAILYLTLEKPFNPILGETFQAFIKGCPIYFEQISHHPPIAAFQFFGRGYKFEGNLEVQASMRPNTVVGRNHGLITITFGQNRIQMNQFSGVINGITFGDRSFYLDGQMIIVDLDNKLVLDAAVNPSNGFFSKQKKTMDYLEARIYEVDESEIERYKRLGMDKYDGIRNQKQFKQVSLINGRWPTQMFADDNEIFNIFRDFPYYLEKDNQVLASDSRYREDLIVWKTRNFELAMEKKV